MVSDIYVVVNSVALIAVAGFIARLAYSAGQMQQKVDINGMELLSLRRRLDSHLERNYKTPPERSTDGPKFKDKYEAQ